MEPSSLFEATSVNPPTVPDGTAVERRLDILGEAAKEAGQSAGKLRAALSQVEENAKTGGVITQGRIDRLSESVAELSSLVGRVVEQAAGFHSGDLSASDFMRELETELVKRGVKVTKGPEPYWLVYPAWFTIGRDSKGVLEVVLNGEKLDSIRPTVVATKIADAVSEKFNAKQFKELLVSVRDVIRRAGGNGGSLALEDVYEVLSLGTGRRSARGGELSKAAFYYSVHRLAEGVSSVPGPTLNFPPANRTDALFFTKDGDSRKYISVDFSGAS